MSWWKRSLGACGRGVWNSWSIGWLIVLLAVVTAIPVLQLMVLGYLLLVAGRIAAGATVRQSVPGVHAAGQMGLVLTAIGIASLPTQMLAHWESVATIIQPDSSLASRMRVLAITFSLLATVHLWWAWARGGSLRHFLWPQPKRFMREAWRPALWAELSDRIWRFIASLRLPMLFWMGVRGAIGTLVWLIPAMIIMAVTRDGKQAAAGLLGGICFLVLGYILMTLPMLQAHYAAENRFRAIFDWRRVRRDVHFAPWSYAAAMLVALVLMPIPLYLLKIEATPEEIVWLPCLVFVAFMLPARIATGLALRRGRRLRRLSETEGDGSLPKRFFPKVSRWFVRFAMAPTIVAFYLFVLFGSQFTSWDGVDTWVRQHALLVPLPFIGV
ncbi:DUF4013 domain-containing protein [Neorhodopirellula pilleata]|nr:DUF4013 domain-containing protein [Neorhodopirellula pilleata]